jgi:hypothetical protein
VFGGEEEGGGGERGRKGGEGGGGARGAGGGAHVRACVRALCLNCPLLPNVNIFLCPCGPWGG